MPASLVYDYAPGDEPTIPWSMLPINPEWPDDEAAVFDAAMKIIEEKKQFMGTPAEKLLEVAGRICYDSLGTGRDSEGFHGHIREVNHGSVWEHYNFNSAFIVTDMATKLGCDPNFLLNRLYEECVNRPGAYISVGDPVSEQLFSEGHGEELLYQFRISQNLRTAMEWSPRVTDPIGLGLSAAVMRGIKAHAPMVLGHNNIPDVTIPGVSVESYIEEPINDEERWISLYMHGSRGFSHEQVRHKHRTAVSQRSTRYVDEAESSYMHHPLIMQYCEARAAELTISTGSQVASAQIMASLNILNSMSEDQATYEKCVDALQAWLLNKLVEEFKASNDRRTPTKEEQRPLAFSARKQARGAARGYLGNALSTEFIFSASVAQWKRMLRQRASDAADAEIRIIYTDVLKALKSSRYASSFDGIEVVQAKDGLGRVAVFR